uniref:Peptidase A1 domain-containing protein n=1 Tax=Tanacetum cinerariifolium TaxID=118510 RepID=A0A6L2LER1_TANCI|nr:hypothetical protein [Tanacetum cinerariifolium]
MPSLKKILFQALLLESSAVVYWRASLAYQGGLRKQPLKVTFPRVYLFDSDKNCNIASRVYLNDWSSVLRRNPRGGSVGSAKGYPVASSRSLIDSAILDTGSEATRWNRNIPSSVSKDLWASLAKWWELDIPVCDNIEDCRSTDTSDGLPVIQAQVNNLGREIKKLNGRVYAAQVGFESCNGPHYTKDFPLKEEGKTIKEAYYTQFGVPFTQGG